MSILVCGCNPPKASIQKFDSYYTAGHYDAAMEYAKSKISDDHRGKGEDLLWCLNTATICRLKQMPEESNIYFDYAEEIMNRHQADRNKLGENLGGSIINDNIVAYTGKEYDGIMTNVYKALNFIVLGNYEYARVEFNRALDRQRRAIEFYNKEVQSMKEELAKQNKKDDKKPADVQDVDNTKYKDIISRNYPDLYQYEVYNDFVNPFANYMAGLFFYLEGDYSKSVDLLKESAGMNSDNEYIVSDFKMAEDAAINNTVTNIRYVWVIYENGLSPYKDEMLFGLPIPINNEPIYIQIALPKLENRNPASANLIVNANGQEVKSKLIASMDRVIQTEFKKEYTMILTRAIVNATAKAVIQYAVKDQDPMIRLAAIAGTALTNVADVRMWTTLPKNFQVAKVEIPQDGKISITIPGSEIKEITLQECKNAIVYVKLPIVAGVPTYDIMKF